MLNLEIFPGDLGTQPNLISGPKFRSTRLRYANSHKRPKALRVASPLPLGWIHISSIEQWLKKYTI